MIFAIVNHEITARTLDLKSVNLQLPLSAVNLFERVDPSRIWKLKKALYDLQNAGREWYLLITESIVRLDFKRVVSQKGIFIRADRDGDKMLILLYVDDLSVVESNTEKYANLPDDLREEVDNKDLGLLKEFCTTHSRKAKTAI